jgi:hypothetical protein
MFIRTSVRLSVLLLAFGAFAASPARAQFSPRDVDDRATGETYRVEGSFGMWFPSSDMTINSSALGILGNDINFKDDLGLTDQHFTEIHAVLRPFKKHKLRFQYIPILFDQSATLKRDIIFEGQRYRVGVPVNSTLDWKAFRFAYEYDFLYQSRWFAGLILDAKYTDVFAQLQTPVDTAPESIHARAPIPTIGGIVRGYVMPNISITGEMTGFTLGDLINNYRAHYVDVDVYGTVNVTNNFGAQMGYRTFDVGYTVTKNSGATTDAGSFVLKGLYFGGVARF